MQRYGFTKRCLFLLPSIRIKQLSRPFCPPFGDSSKYSFEEGISFCVPNDLHDVLLLRFALEIAVLAGVLTVSKSLKEASLLGVFFLVGLAALEGMLYWAGF